MNVIIYPVANAKLFNELTRVKFSFEIHWMKTTDPTRFIHRFQVNEIIFELCHKAKNLHHPLQTKKHLQIADAFEIETDATFCLSNNKIEFANKTTVCNEVNKVIKKDNKKKLLPDPKIYNLLNTSITCILIDFFLLKQLFTFHRLIFSTMLQDFCHKTNSHEKKLFYAIFIILTMALIVCDFICISFFLHFTLLTYSVS